jgi:hypothetical protein
MGRGGERMAFIEGWPFEIYVVLMKCALPAEASTMIEAQLASGRAGRKKYRCASFGANKSGSDSGGSQVLQ